MDPRPSTTRKLLKQRIKIAEGVKAAMVSANQKLTQQIAGVESRSEQLLKSQQEMQSRSLTQISAVNSEQVENCNQVRTTLECAMKMNAAAEAVGNTHEETYEKYKHGLATVSKDFDWIEQLLDGVNSNPANRINSEFRRLRRKIELELESDERDDVVRVGVGVGSQGHASSFAPVSEAAQADGRRHPNRRNNKRGVQVKDKLVNAAVLGNENNSPGSSVGNQATVPAAAAADPNVDNHHHHHHRRHRRRGRKNKNGQSNGLSALDGLIVAALNSEPSGNEISSVPGSWSQNQFHEASGPVNANGQYENYSQNGSVSNDVIVAAVTNPYENGSQVFPGPTTSIGTANGQQQICLAMEPSNGFDNGGHSASSGTSEVVIGAAITETYSSIQAMSDAMNSLTINEQQISFPSPGKVDEYKNNGQGQIKYSGSTGVDENLSNVGTLTMANDASMLEKVENPFEDLLILLPQPVSQTHEGGGAMLYEAVSDVDDDSTINKLSSSVLINTKMEQDNYAVVKQNLAAAAASTVDKLRSTINARASTGAMTTVSASKGPSAAVKGRSSNNGIVTQSPAQAAVSPKSAISDKGKAVMKPKTSGSGNESQFSVANVRAAAPSIIMPTFTLRGKATMEPIKLDVKKSPALGGVVPAPKKPKSKPSSSKRRKVKAAAVAAAADAKQRTQLAPETESGTTILEKYLIASALQKQQQEKQQRQAELHGIRQEAVFDLRSPQHLLAKLKTEFLPPVPKP